MGMGHGVLPGEHVVQEVEKRLPGFRTCRDFQIDIFQLARAFPDACFDEVVHQLGVDRHTVVVGELESLKFPAQTHFFKVGGGEGDLFLDGNADNGVALQFFDDLGVHLGVSRDDQFALVIVDVFTDDHAVFQCHACYIFHRKPPFLRGCI